MSLPSHDGSSLSARPTPLLDLQLKSVVAIAIAILWNVAIVIALGVILVISFEEKPTVPLRVWIFGYGFLRLTGIVVILFMDWSKTLGPRDKDSETGGDSVEDHNDKSTLYRFITKLSKVHAVITIIWCIFGIVLLIIGGIIGGPEAAPKLYWSTAFFVAMFFVIVFVYICSVLRLDHIQDNGSK